MQICILAIRRAPYSYKIFFYDNLDIIDQEDTQASPSQAIKKRLTKHRDYPKLRQALVAIDKLCADLLSTNFFLVEADCYHRFADGTLNFDDALYCCRICVKQPFIFTTWTCHMHFLHFISPPVRGQLKGNVKLTVDYIRHHSSAHKFRDYHPNVAIL